MSLKKIIYLLLLCGILYAIYFFFFPGKHFPKTKSLIILNRPPLTGTESEYNIRSTDNFSIIEDSSAMQHFNKIRRMRGTHIVKNSMLAKAVTADNDTINIIVSFPGGYIINQKDKKRYGFPNNEKQEMLSNILTQSASRPNSNPEKPRD